MIRSNFANLTCPADAAVTTTTLDLSQPIPCSNGIHSADIASIAPPRTPVPTATIEEAVDQINKNFYQGDAKVALLGADPQGVRYRFFLIDGSPNADFVFAEAGSFGDGWQPVHYDRCN